MLGTADFIRRLVKGEPSRAEKILGKIVQIKNALTGKGDANKEIAFVQKAERLYLNAIAELGGTYRDGKIHLANREEDEKARTATEDAQFSAENSAESVDESGELRYNKKDNYTALRGWAEGVLSEEDRRLLREKIAEATKGKSKAHVQLSDGSYLLDVNNKIVLVRGDFDAPVYDAVIDINADTETEALHFKEVLLSEFQRQQYSLRECNELVEALLGEKYVKIHNRTDYLASNGSQIRSFPTREAARGDYGYSSEQRYGRRNVRKVKEYHFNEDGSTDVTYSDGSTEHEAPKEKKGEDILFSRTVKTDGQAAKDHADRNYGKIYTRKDAREIISAALTEHLTFADEGVFGNLVGKSREQAIEALWKGLNSAEEGQRAGLALDMADFIIENAVAEDLYDDGDNTEQLERLKILRGYMHKLDLSAIKAEIEYKLGKKNTAALVWGARKNTRGIAVDVAAMELAERGIALKGGNPADLFFAMQDAYRSAAESIKKQGATRLAETMGEGAA